ncbi:MAG: cytochrome c oxidase subunit II [Gaiellaceae bacterium]
MTRMGHARRILAIWLVTSAIGMTLVAIFLSPHLPPGNGSKQATGQRFDNEVLTLISVLVTMMIFVYFGYVLVVFRARGTGTTVDGPPIRGHMRIQTAWIVGTTITVLFLAAFGTYELLGGAGGGQGSAPVFVPSASAATFDGKTQSPMQVQVIGQQWQFTFRYPDQGGFESAHFVLPVNREVELHVTSLDVIHSFWVPKLGLKADANPGADNIAYITPTKIGSVHIECAELCGLFHGYMFDTGHIVSQGDFAAWAKRERQFVSPITKSLPKYSPTYLPDPAFRAG